MGMPLRWVWSLVMLPTISSMANAEPPTLDAFRASKPLVLEIRYCRCAAFDLDNPSSVSSTEFLEASEVISTGVASEDKGFVSSREMTVGYALTPVEKDGPASFLMDYAATYVTGGEESSGHGELLITVNQWTYLFGTVHQTETEIQNFGIAVRLVESEEYP